MTSEKMGEAIEAFLADIAPHRAANTVASYGRDLRHLAAGLQAAGIADWAAVDHYALVTLFAVENQTAKGATTQRYLSSLRQFYRFLVTTQRVDQDPTRNLTLPKPVAAEPVTLTEAEVAKLLAAVTGDDPLTLRDRALLELLYATGVKVSEALDLPASAVDLELMVVTVVAPSGQARVLPLGKPAAAALRRYLEVGRPALQPTGEALFVNARGKALSRQAVWQLFRRWGEEAGLNDVTPQILRNSVEAHLLAHQADYLAVMQLMGKQLPGASTLSFRRLAAAYYAAHPRAKEEVSDASGLQ